MVTAAKTISQIGLHMGVAFGVMYAVTGSIAFGGLAAILEPICNVILIPLHDRLWEKLRKRMQRHPAPKNTEAERKRALPSLYVAFITQGKPA